MCQYRIPGLSFRLTQKARVELRFENASLIYPPSVHALDSACLRVASGTCVAVVGPSGGGKTTLLRLAAGLLRPTTGTVCHGSRRASDIPPEGRGVAVAFQVPAIYPHLTAGENLAFPLRYHPLPAAEATRLLEDVAAAFGLSDLLSRKPHELSGGERQRVALGRCLVRRPAVLLLDEPLGQLDVPLRAAVRDAIFTRCRDRGTTVLWVTHDPAEAAAVGDRVVEVRKGRLSETPSGEV
ncbi:sugar abc transporter atp-binding protein : ATPase component of ABC-type sugar transporter OS=Singulisphaera acidiphila (strain ATCC BAA-1392 / DSM 18658 / VKM B-2454 / MOB10) GN=Sinac_3305 PE=4 SV=1: ABC_tran [Gemmataceae bacterium]|nr:sugar abc transporter atp-binding protein : ATPase component of ABC-type sugar transporter OS=Singulisphaera acidiphila (strain ATCC BAA-1392 / DSM 18658 / VKM B-2454 / MOB10) GN=Sinac_3305 PE=4 SV=1: ABC_tran [Gemmataceae bacterium]VTT96918.1 sugar abc transporter atp-binding protein : ATPase component of ABC-type sugar transporter OS=Singulisphaera acidiphila (strain ATCC BAA-1392 / DSM 18658 / VKM B-2454 / MOB10) GN=Sinac_3305 PE=4 SV=1: ABC_tran [Gemmataceae bacterium]